ncbi:MCE family protein [Actinomadura mexicana]|uniref:Phospholipid/cholesterol/gamma-HCH transport system substrate-binding protein n=1 Tax=Actinomadura mexicana TaxID=134959 RepID=A0A239DJD1_9ACTN|nr:MCE family protein [Actinomadura mexicana]SNS32349.1 phospholipid/cholesterol/gamma-HCH transport system substrate-binding protein [Actinomadura mexicana]
MRIPFRERNPVPIGLSAFAIIIVLVALAMNLENIPLISGGKTHTAAFREAAGLRAGEEVRIAGVKVGKVTGLELDGDHVKVTFRVDDGVRLGDRTEADIKIKTILGAHYLALTPRGRGRLGRSVPIERTHTPFEVVPAISELSQRVGAIDVQQVAKSFDVLSDTFKNSPEEVRASLQGLRRLSNTVASRDDELHELAGKAKDVSQLLADRNQDFAALVQDGDKVLQAVQARREVIHQLLINTVTLSQQVNALINENDKQLRPMLDNLAKVNRILLKNQNNLDRILQLFAPFARQFSDVTGTGRWFDSWIQNLIPIPASIQNPPSGGGATTNRQGARPGGGSSGPGKTGNSDNPLPFLP